MLMPLLYAVLVQGATATPQTMIAGTAGRWRGSLDYRDYQNDRWQGLPVEVTIVAQPDGVTTVRTAAFDDGPTTGTVWITTVAMTQGDRQSYAGFRKGREIDSGSVMLTVPAPPRDATHWTIVASDRRIDGDSMARIRETTTRDGDTLTTLKEVDPEGDGMDAWLPRNRTVLKRID